MSKPAIEKAKQQGFNVFWGDVTAAAYPDNYFDVVIASEVIEHLEKPAISHLP
ncbi:class I SAM-dependent methyltransferase [Parathermosynechococcus lividus]